MVRSARGRVPQHFSGDQREVAVFMRHLIKHSLFTLEPFGSLAKPVPHENSATGMLLPNLSISGRTCSSLANKRMLPFVQFVASRSKGDRYGSVQGVDAQYLVVVDGIFCERVGTVLFRPSLSVYVSLVRRGICLVRLCALR
jgi:hypothetical protein